jgi:TM2 domain-containing membrane protein YozV
VEATQPAVRREPWFAVNLSLFLPGLGHFYAGRRARGLWCIATLAVLSATAVFLLLSPGGSTWGVVGAVSLQLLLQVLAAVDAHRRVRLANDVPFESERRSTKDPWFAVLLSRLLLPGVGHLYLGRRGHGILLLLAASFLLAISGRLPTANLLLAVLIGFACFDVYRSAPAQRDA